ncbi:hypothetical protein MK805_00905 [Shimazuella sp. AN120528]|uniref:hypothetical protein n=1 Tax=Shimazuella soli TaxID=1892854 RepID=UPI001F0D3839|nr:hypothetical protein [Shimazuella soli]MCH5583530.1 hypothetical protein [Shimazuella soli]
MSEIMQYEVVPGDGVNNDGYVSITFKTGCADFIRANADEITESQNGDFVRIEGGGISLDVDPKKNSFQVNQMTRYGCVSSITTRPYDAIPCGPEKLNGADWWTFTDSGNLVPAV